MAHIGRRIAEWVDTRRLSRTARQVRAERLTYLSPRKLLRIESALADVRRREVPGDLVEFGVALGGSAVLLARQARDGHRFFGLDVFGMIPPPDSERDDVKSRERYRVIAGRAASGIGGDVYYGYREDLHAEVAGRLARFGAPVDGVRVRLVKGLFQETLPSLDLERIAFAHVDCDWYEPVRYCLAELAKRLSTNGLIVIDDYHDYAGCRAAVDEFLAAHPAFSLDPGRNPILRRNA